MTPMTTHGTINRAATSSADTTPARGEPLFSVVIPAYNAEKYLRQTLNSVLDQAETNFEIIVVDDGSTDTTAAIVCEFGERVRLIQQPNAGCHGARNTGIAAATGRYIAFMDADDLWFPWTLATYRLTVEQNADAVVILAQPRMFEGHEDQLNCRDGELRTRRWPDFLAGGDRSMWTGTSVMLVHRSTLVRSDRWFKLGCLSDLDFLLRIGDLGPFVKIDWPITLGYRKHATNLSRSGDRLSQAIKEILSCERRGEYAGDTSRQDERRRIISLHAAHCARYRLFAGDIANGWRIYRRTFWLHATVRRWDAIWKWPAHLANRILLQRRKPAKPLDPRKLAESAS